VELTVFVALDGFLLMNNLLGSKVRFTISCTHSNSAVSLIPTTRWSRSSSSLISPNSHVSMSSQRSVTYSSAVSPSLWSLLCGWCGRRKHQCNKQCPARNAICHNCKNRGHSKAYCLSKPSAASTATEETEEDAAFLGMLSSKAQESTTWRSTLSLNNREVQFKLDTGAEVTAVSEETYKQVYGKHLQHPSKVLYGPVYQSLKVLGQSTGKLSSKERVQSGDHIRCARTQKQPARLTSTDCTPAGTEGRDYLHFEGLGSFREPYTIQLKDDARPHALYTLRKCAHTVAGKGPGGA